MRLDSLQRAQYSLRRKIYNTLGDSFPESFSFPERYSLEEDQHMVRVYSLLRLLHYNRKTKVIHRLFIHFLMMKSDGNTVNLLQNP